MTDFVESELEDELVRWVIARNEDDDLAVEITAETNLFTIGALDSMGFVGLITLFEDRIGREIDFEQVDPAELVSIRALLKLCL